MNITEFLELRIIEDEAEARKYRNYEDPARLLCECTAKRRIIAECQAIDNEAADAQFLTYGTDRILGFLAAVYKDHPDYQEEWAV